MIEESFKAFKEKFIDEMRKTFLPSKGVNKKFNILIRDKRYYIFIVSLWSVCK